VQSALNPYPKWQQFTTDMIFSNCDSEPTTSR